MVYTASDAIDLVYRIVGKIGATTAAPKKDKPHLRVIAMDIKEFYRGLIKSKVKSESEVLNIFNTHNWTLTQNETEEESKIILENIKNMFWENFFIENNDLYYLDPKHVDEEIHKVYDLALENSFIQDKESIDWEHTIRNIESMFLQWVRSNNIKQDETLKSNLLTIVEKFNDNDEEQKYSIKLEVAANTMKSYEEFIKEYEAGTIPKNLPMMVEKYNYYKETLAWATNFGDTQAEYNYQTLVNKVNAIPDDASEASFEDIRSLVLRIFYAWIIDNKITSITSANFNSKMSMIRDNGGLKISFEKTEINNIYIALTQKPEIIKRMITMSGKSLNWNTVEVVRKLIENNLKIWGVEKFVAVETNETYNLPNPMVIKLFFDEIESLIMYHEHGGVFDPLDVNTSKRQLTLSKANELLNFDNLPGVVAALKASHQELNDFPDTVISRTIKYISSLGEVGME